jgi:predicted RNase H-like HicB family nuclease
VAFGEGDTRQEAIEDLQAGVALVFEDEGAVPDWLPRADVLAIPEIA